MKFSNIFFISFLNVFFLLNSLSLKSQNSDSLAAKRIDSLTKNVKIGKLGKKIMIDGGGSENYHYYKSDKTIYLIAVYEDDIFLWYYFRNNELVKVTYGKRKHKLRSNYYFANGILIYKKENINIEIQNTQNLLVNAQKLKAKS